jgi:hypothetical protein
MQSLFRVNLFFLRFLGFLFRRGLAVSRKLREISVSTSEMIVSLLFGVDRTSHWFKGTVR